MPLPAEPLNPTATTVGPHQIDLAWTNPLGYEAIEISRKPAGGAYGVLVTVGLSQGHQDKTPQDGINYVYRFRGQYGGVWSAYSEEVDATTPLPAPSGMSGTALSSTSIRWSFNDNSQNEAGFKIYGPNALNVYDVLIATLGQNVKTYDETGLTPATWNKRKVLAYNTAYGNSPFSNEASVFTADPPARPTLLTPTVTATTKIRNNLIDNSYNEDGFKIERSEISGTAGFALVATLGAGITTDEDDGLTSNKQYWYRSYAYNASGDSGYSNVVTATTWAAISRPSNLTVVAAKVGGAYGVECRFIDNSELEDSHILERGIDTFSGEIITDGGLENWINANNLTSWTEGGGTSTVNQDGADKHGGSYSCRIDVEAGGTSKIVLQNEVLSEQSRYKLSFWYKTEAGKTSSFSFYPATASTSRLQLDGTWAATSFVALPTATAWTQISIIFTAPISDTYRLYFGHWSGISVAAGSSLWFDDFSLLADANYSGDVLTDGALENWDSATALTSWGESVTGTSTVNREGTGPHGGTYACRIDADASQSLAYIYQTPTLVKGAGYKLTFWYKTAAGKTAALRVVNTGTPAVTLALDGTWSTSDLWMVLPTATGWTKVVIEFQAHSMYADYQVVFGCPDTFCSCASASIWIDDVSITAGTFGTTVATLAPNRTYYHDTGVSAGETHRWRARAKQGASTYSAYCNEVTYTVPSAPATPADFAVAEYQDTWVRFAWTKTSGEVGQIIEQSVDEGANWTEALRIGAGIDAIKVYGLTASTDYQWRISAYNGAGTSAASAAVSQTTRAAYLPSKYERLIRRPNAKLRYLVEVNPAIQIQGWSLTSGKTYTYEAAFDEGGAVIDEVHANGVKLTVKTSTAEVEATAGTWWHDTANKKVYVHTLSGTDPINETVIGGFWLYFTTRKNGTAKGVYDGKNYLPLVAADGIPDITQAIQKFYVGAGTVSSGTINLINGKVTKQHYFDRRFGHYLWLNRKARILAGGDSFAFTDFGAVFTGLINSVPIDDRRTSLVLRDYREGARRTLPVENFTLDAFPGMNPDQQDTPRPFWFGPATNVVPVCIDVTNRVFEVNHGRIKTFSLTQNGTALSENTDYFVDYQRGRFTLGRDLTYVADDVLLAAFSGGVNTADESISNGAEIFRWIHNEFLNIPDSELDLDEIYRTKYVCTQVLVVGLRKGEESPDVIRGIERSIRAYTVQNAEGKIGIRSERTAAESGAPYVWNAHVLDHSAELTTDYLFSAIDVQYAENPSNDTYAVAHRSIPQIAWKYGVNKSMDPPYATYLSAAADALALANALVVVMTRPLIKFRVPGILFGMLPGDIICYSRDRYPSADGTASAKPVRILSITKQKSQSRTLIEAEEV